MDDKSSLTEEREREKGYVPIRWAYIHIEARYIYIGRAHETRSRPRPARAIGKRAYHICERAYARQSVMRACIHFTDKQP